MLSRPKILDSPNLESGSCNFPLNHKRPPRIKTFFTLLLHSLDPTLLLNTLHSLSVCLCVCLCVFVCTVCVSPDIYGFRAKLTRPEVFLVQWRFLENYRSLFLDVWWLVVPIIEQITLLFPGALYACCITCSMAAFPRIIKGRT